MSAKLICVKGPYVGQEFPIGARGAVIGRDPASASIVLEFPTVSRSHANVFVAPDGRVVVQDLGSTNGTWTVDGAGEKKRITNETILSNGGRFSVGDGGEYVFEVIYTAEAPAANAPAYAAPAFNTPLPAAPIQANDLWSDSLRILSKIMFVLLILGGICLGGTAYQIASLGELFGRAFGAVPWGLKLTAFLVPAIAGIVGAFWVSAQLDMAADIREVRNVLTKR